MGICIHPLECLRCAPVRARRVLTLAALVGAAGLAASTARAGYTAPLPAYAPPTNYYANATGTGSTLHMNLHTIISTGFIQQAYGNARYAEPDSDKDPANPNNLLTVYDRTSLSNVWDSGVTWNREHTWPASRINGGATGPTADLFELRPANSKTNSSRGNLPYGGGSNASGTPFVDSAGTYFFPGDYDKGDVARGMFYMATMYYTGSPTLSSTNLQLINGTTLGSYQMGDLASLLAWNYQDGVDTFERNRNQVIYSDPINPIYSQNNRNPFVDHPEYVWTVFGDRLNNAQISVSTPSSSGSSTANISLGRIITGGSFGTSTATFTKTGYTPTTFDITLGGNAAIPNANANGTAPSGYLIAGVGQGIDFNNQTRSISVGLNASTATTGLKSGTVTVHNTDLTSAGAGLGSADGNDTINVSGSVLGKRTVSPSTNAIVFGTVIVGASVSSNITLTTSGDDNNFTRVNVAGNSSTDANGISIPGTTTLFNSAASTASRTVGGTLSSVGAKSGALALSVTTAENNGSGLTGEGAYSAIGISYTANVLSHATPSFDPTTTASTLTLTFPIVAANSASPSQSFSLANLVSSTAAGLDFTGDAITGSTAFSTDLANFQNETQNSSHLFNATLATTLIGTFSTTYTLNFSDEQDLPGAVARGPLTLTLNGTVALPGDANLDGSVDLTDLNTVLNNLGSATAAWQSGNFDGAATIDLTDLNTVLNNLGTSIPAGSASLAEAESLIAAGSVPEPATVGLLLLAVPILLRRRSC